ncbi:MULTISPECIES: sulfotransferase [unclassified Candidatus Frackibacter]|uniref:sulfotransferase n=1 Tax=unclassified Candidatus Frackibacter TaxID=2648818 RepID=UPI000890BEDF|nr:MULTISPECIES: sulfotransferase [unclassified Candidatus Frackibacter]SDC82728.1 Sulfotransferase domain-containing protein [Candidatus Frackibacter sp. WG11]SEM97204.1 Sulfotransferase domain-containing protein [Candidatus Frackibacter sp. WG12]SFM05848.1 Sulfotransferase domain-containing protein [Candidatus Frackibacter sp. WG13]
MNKLESKTVVVLGMHRNGTSMTSGILSKLGIDMGRELIGKKVSNPLGHFEDKDFLDLNIKILKEAGGGSWDSTPAREDILDQKDNFQKEIKSLLKKKNESSSNIWGWKDPRTSLTIDLYLPYLKNPYFLVCYRNSKTVAESLQRRNQMELEEGKKLKKTYDQRIGDFFKEYSDSPRLDLHYEAVTTEPKKWVRRIINFLDIQVSKQEEKEAIEFIMPNEAVRNLQSIPNFIIIGEKNCGVIPLYKYLVSHPNVIPACKEEIQFFNKNFNKGEDWYLNHFSEIRKLCKDKYITGEVSTNYFFYPYVPQRVFRMLPEVKLIVLLRNPVNRAYAHYCGEVLKGIERLSFKKALEKEEERLFGEIKKMKRDKDYFSFKYNHFSYKARSIYINQLKRWLNIFPREQLLILKSEDLYAGPEEVMNKIIKFLNLPEWNFKEHKKIKRNRNHFINKSIETQLYKYFKRYNRRLFKLLNVDWNWDK